MNIFFFHFMNFSSYNAWLSSNYQQQFSIQLVTLHFNIFSKLFLIANDY